MNNKSSDDKKITDSAENYSVEPDDKDDPYSKELSIEPTTSTKNEPPKSSNAPRRTFHSKAIQHDLERNETSTQPKSKLSHAETSGVVISAVMLVYSLAEQDKPLFFLSTALMIFLLRPLIGALFGKNNQAVQNALHSFSIVMFIGALIMLFL